MAADAEKQKELLAWLYNNRQFDFAVHNGHPRNQFSVGCDMRIGSVLCKANSMSIWRKVLDDCLFFG